MSDPITKITRLDYRLTRIAEAAASRSKIVAKHLPDAAQAARIRAAASRFSTELLDIAAELASMKESDPHLTEPLTSPKGGPVSRKVQQTS